jgi:hypothetical protein
LVLDASIIRARATTELCETLKRKADYMNTIKRLLGFTMKHADVEMFQKGWWMLLLIIGSIALLFTIACVLISRY